MRRACELGALAGHSGASTGTSAIGLMLFREDSVRTILGSLLRMLREREPGVSPRDVTPEAACKARYRLGVEPLRHAFEERAAFIDPPATFRGLRVYALDGTTMDMPDTPANEAFFGRPKASRGHAAFPQIRLVVLVAACNHRIRGIEWGTCNAPERPSGLSLLRKLRTGDVAILDRGYPSRLFCYEASRCAANFLVRLPSHWRLDAVESLADGSVLVDFQVKLPLPEEEQTRKRKTTTEVVRVRLVEYRVDGGEVIRLLTDLVDSELYPALEIAKLYHERWESEVNNAETKVTLAAVKTGRQATIFRSKQPEGVLQELYAMFLAYDLVREMMQDAAESRGVPPRELSLTQALHIIREAIPRFDRATKAELPFRYGQLLDDLALATIDRPRRPRRNPRVVKRKMSNYGVKKKGMRGEVRAFAVRLLAALPGPTG